MADAQVAVYGASWRPNCRRIKQFLEEHQIPDRWVDIEPEPAGFEQREPTLLETSIPGIFAAGDVRAGGAKQVASATGEGATAALLIREYLKRV